MEVNKLWKNNDTNKYYIITLDKETNEWKFFKEIVGHTVFWKDKPSSYGMTKSKAIEVLNIVKSLTNEDVKPENNNGTETEPENGTTPTENEGTTTPTEPETPVTPETPSEPTEEPQYKIITISSVTYNSEKVPIFDDVDYNKLKSTLTYINSTYPNTNVHVVTKSDTGKSIFYFYLEDELTWFLELRTNIDYSLVNHVTTLDNIKELL